MLSYDRTVVLNFYDSIASRTNRAFAGANLSFEAGLLAALVSDKIALEGKVEESVLQGTQLWTLLSRQDFGFCISDISLEDLFSCSANIEYGTTIAPFDDAADAFLVCSHHGHEVSNWVNVSSPSFNRALSSISGVCPHCCYRGALVEHEVGGCGPVFISLLCPACGGRANADDLIAQFTTSIIYLAKIAPLENLSRKEVLLRLVVAAIAILMYLLKATILRHEIAISQRSFFTHHGAHPPRVQPQPASGLLRGRVFQPHVTT